MTRTMAAHVFVAPTSITLVIGLLVTRTLHGSRAATLIPSHPRRARSGAMLRFRPTQLDSPEWEPLRIAVSELRDHGLRRWPNAPGIYFARDDSIHCRRCVTDHRIRAAIVTGRDDNDQTLVLFGGSDEATLVDANCATHTPPTAPVDQRR